MEKLTVEYAKKLAFDWPLTITEREESAYVDGYMKAVKETNAKELLEALIELRDKAYNTGINEDEVYAICIKAINKATK